MDAELRRRLMNIDPVLAEKVRAGICSFSIKEWTPCKTPILQGEFTIFIENGIEPGAAVRILDEEQQKYYSAILTRFDDDGIEFEIVDLEGK